MPTKVRRTIRWLRRHYPTRTPVIVKAVKNQPGLHGVCEIGDGRALIKLTLSSEQMMRETLIEEWCHVLRTDCPLPVGDDHDALFWAILGQVTKHWRGEI
jgi:hypothetical protein